MIIVPDPDRVIYLKTWSLASGAIGRVYGLSRLWSFAGESVSLEMDFPALYFANHFLFTSGLLCASET